MKDSAKFFIYLILAIIVACSTEPVETGPFRTDYKCNLDGLYYTNKLIYDYACNEENADQYQKYKTFLSQPTITKKCDIDNTEFESHFYINSEIIGMSARFDSATYTIMTPLSLDSFWVDEFLPTRTTTRYICFSLLPSNINSVFTDSTCSDTLGIQAIIDVFANFPDSLCEELPKD